MQYLVKDLARLTGLSPARIRKWQERYGLLEPVVGTNGYHYYSSDDLFLLQRINRRLENGESLAEVVEKGREDILSGTIANGFNNEQRDQIALIAAGDFIELGARFDQVCGKIGIAHCLHGPMQSLAELVGHAWELGYLGVADEHAYTRWFVGYVEKWIQPTRSRKQPVWLVVTHPEDEHELGALMHYCDLMRRGVAARFCGHLPERELFRELAGRTYRKLSISVVLPRTDRELQGLKNRINARYPDLSVRFGGIGYRTRIAEIGAATSRSHK